jgi:hypothetical protein
MTALVLGYQSAVGVMECDDGLRGIFAGNVQKKRARERESSGYNHVE